LIEYHDDNGLFKSHGRLGITFFQALKLERILSVNGESTAEDTEKARRLMLENLGKVTKIGMDIGDFSETFLIRPDEKINDGLLDSSSKDYEIVYVYGDEEKYFHPHSLETAVAAANKKVAEVFDKAIKIMGLILTGTNKKQSLGGMGSMGKYAGKAFNDSTYAFFGFLAVLSIQIAFINLFPIPTLDGGYVVFIGYEMLARKPVPYHIQQKAFIMGLVILLGIMIIANVNDLLQLIKN